MSQPDLPQSTKMHQIASPGNNIHASGPLIDYILRPRKHLSEIKKTAIDLLLQGLADQDVAAQVGADRSTIFRWRRQPRFARALEAQRQLRRERAANQLQSMVPGALKILQQQLDSSDNRERLRAVSILLRFATPSRLAGAGIVAAAAGSPDNAAARGDDLIAYIECPLPGEAGGPGTGEGLGDDNDQDNDDDDDAA